MPTPEYRIDPTALTTAQLVREVASLKELLSTRIDAIEKAQIAFQEGITRVPTEVSLGISRLKELHEARFAGLITLIDEKFGGVAAQFALRDKSVKETAELTGLALTAALASAEKASAKQTDWFSASQSKLEITFTKQIDAMSETVKTLSTVLNDKLNDVKYSQTLVSGNASGKSALMGWLAAGVGLLLSLIMAALAAAAFFVHGK